MKASTGAGLVCIRPAGGGHRAASEPGRPKARGGGRPAGAPAHQALPMSSMSETEEVGTLLQ
jgi:hypothetical protein